MRDGQGPRIRQPKLKVLLADKLSELCHDLSPASAQWPTTTRNKFNHLYSVLSDIDEKELQQ